MTTLGVVFIPQYPPEALRGIALAAEESGLEELWLWEDCFRESGIATAAAVLAWTSRVRVGVGLLPVPLRNVALTAMELATLERLFPGRCLAGVGHGVQEWMAQVGAAVESPMTLLREYVGALQALLRGETVTVSGRYVTLDAVGLDWPPAAPMPVLVGGVGPKSLRLTGEIADGTILTGGIDPARTRESVAHVLAGRTAAGRTGAHPVTTYLIAATGPGADERLIAEQRRWNLDPADGAGVAGDAEAIAAAVRRWADAGVSTVVLQPTADEPDPAGFVRFVGEKVRPLLA